MNSQSKKTMDIIIGHTLTGFNVDDRNISLQLDEKYWVDIGIEADCCSESYVESVHGVERVVGHVITDIKEMELEQGEPCAARHYQEELSIYCLKISASPENTSLGEISRSILIDYRNESNGYYGAYLEWGTEQRKTPKAGTNIKNSWVNPHS